MFDLDPYDGTDTLGMFPIFLKRTADFKAPVSVKCFGGLFVWVVSQLSGDRPSHPILKGPPSSSVANY